MDMRHNLSSHHIITTANNEHENYDDRHFYLGLNKRCEYKAYEKEYDWCDFNCLGTMSEKFDYCIASMLGYLIHPNGSISSKYTKSKTPKQLNDSHDRLLHALIRFSNTGISKIVGTFKYFGYDKKTGYEYEDYNYFGAVVADSKDLVTEFLKENHISLYEFLTNKKYVIITDDADRNYFKYMIDVGLIDESKIVSDFYVKTNHKLRGY